MPLGHSTALTEGRSAGHWTRRPARPLEPPCHGQGPSQVEESNPSSPEVEVAAADLSASHLISETNLNKSKVPQRAKGKEGNLGLRSQLTLEFSRAVQLLPTKAC